jgi:hypothetical protein
VTHQPPAPESRSRLSDVAASLAEGADTVRRMLGERAGARVRRVRRQGRQPLLNMWQLQPEARLAAMRELGLRTVPLEQIAGTAVEGPTQRGGDFLPLRELRGDDWRARWQRIRGALDRLETLPPVDLLKVGDRYWVVDGHNRVAAALYNGQLEIDADVTELRLPGQPSEVAVGNVAPFLEGSRDVREAGSGRLSRTTARPTPVLPEHSLEQHSEHQLDKRSADLGAGDEPAGKRE